MNGEIPKVQRIYEGMRWAKMDSFLENQGVKRIRAVVHGSETKRIEVERPIVTFTDSGRSGSLSFLGYGVFAECEIFEEGLHGMALPSRIRHSTMNKAKLLKCAHGRARQLHSVPLSLVRLRACWTRSRFPKSPSGLKVMSGPLLQRRAGPTVVRIWVKSAGTCINSLRVSWFGDIRAPLLVSH
jgi:hypothetical protein